MKLSRRNLILTGLQAAAMAPLAGGAADARQSHALIPHRLLGKTGQRVPVLGFGIAPLGSSHTSFSRAEAVLRYALHQGITYLDVSPDYGDAEDKLRAVLKDERHRIFLVTKVNPDQADAKGVQRQIEASLRRLGTDHLDAVHIHNLGDFKPDQVLTTEGALGGLIEARRRGLIRFIGTSGHNRPGRFVAAMETGEIDLTMNALNFADRHTYPFEELVLPAAKKQGAGVVAMKVLGGARSWQYDGKTPGTLAAHHEASIRYSLGLPGVCTAVIGFSTEAEVQAAVDVVRRLKPLSAAEREALLELGRQIALQRGLYYGPVVS